MSTAVPTPIPKSKPKPKLKTKSKRPRHRRRRSSGASNASIISIDHLALKKLRKIRDKVDKEKKIKQRKLQAKRKKKQQSLQLELEKEQLYNQKNKYLNLDASNDFKEEDEYNNDDNSAISRTPSFHALPPPYSNPNVNASNSSGDGMEDITVGELIPLIKNLVEKHNNLQEEYDALDRQLKEQKILMEDKIIKLQQERDLYYNNGNNNGVQLIKKDDMSLPDKTSILRDQYDNKLLDMESKYIDDINEYKAEIKQLNKELNALNYRISILEQSLDVADHENQSLTAAINENNKNFQNIKLFKNKNKSLISENDELKQTINQLQQEIEYLYEQQELQQEQEQNEIEYSMNNDLDDNAYNDNNAPVSINTIQTTPKKHHSYNKTIMVDTSNSKPGSDVDAGGGSGVDDLYSSINDYHLYHQQAASDRGSIDDHDDEYDEKADNNNNNTDNDDQKQPINTQSAAQQLSKYKQDISSLEPKNIAELLKSLTDKDKKRSRTGIHGLGLGTHTQTSQDQLDNFSVASNYSDSEQKLEEQILGIEDDIRELTDLVRSMMDTTNNISPSINQQLQPMKRKVERMYIMLSGGVGLLPKSQTPPSKIIPDDNKSIIPDDISSKHSSASAADNYLRFKWLTPYVHDWMPSIGFSAIILSTMYLLIKYHKGQLFQPRVLRHKGKRK